MEFSIRISNRCVIQVRSDMSKECESSRTCPDFKVALRDFPVGHAAVV